MLVETEFCEKGDRSKMIGAFAPTVPASWKKKPNEWLSSTEIIDVMRQYEKSI